MNRIKLRAIFVSDIHLGTRDAQAEYLLDFLRHTESDYLYLLGDIVDFWKARSGWYWPRLNNNIVQIILAKAAQGTRVIYIPGNHDELLRDYAGTLFNGVEFVNDAVHETVTGRRFLLLHGDEFDTVVRHNRLLTHIGTGAYDLLLLLNRWSNRLRRRMGFPYWSLASYLKHKVDNAVNYIASFEQAVAREAARRAVDGLICGHIHKASIGVIDGVTYANCGDWVEHCTALAEGHDGELRIIRWAEESARLLDEAQACPLGDPVPVPKA